jgi:hypothetical protein
MLSEADWGYASPMAKMTSVAVVVLAAAGLLACQPEPVAETKPKRKSFEEPGYQPATASSSRDSASSGYERTQEQAEQVRDQWDRAKSASTDAEREAAANEALRQTQEMADQASGSGQ